MADVTVAQFADVLKVPVDKLLVQLDQAGIKVSSSHDVISETRAAHAPAPQSRAF
jgi:translation initiation factor IF-2